MEDVKKIEAFLAVGYGYGDGYGDGDGYSSGSGSGYGYGDGDGYGDGYGDGDGYSSGSGYGDGDGSGSGSGDGYGYGSGDGDGSGDGYGYGSGDGDGSGSGLKSYNGQVVHYIDGVPTLIDHVHGAFAKGRIIQGDMTTGVCYIAKQENHFAHGETLKEARAAVLDKMFDDMPEEERIAAFVAEHKPGVKYPDKDFFDWHHRLTGSCEMGRKAFVRDLGLESLDGERTVEGFIRLTENAYGGATIRKLKEFYGGTQTC